MQIRPQQKIEQTQTQTRRRKRRRRRRRRRRGKKENTLTTDLTSYGRSKHENVRMSENPIAASSSHDRCTCSMHGENVHNLPPVTFNAFLDVANAPHGLGRSKKTASHTCSNPNPSLHASACFAVTHSSTPCALNSSAACFARSSWNSKVCT